MTANLLSRLQGLTAPDREVDARIAVEIAGIPATVTIGDGVITEQRRVPRQSPRYTASLDASTALVERVLPGHGYTTDHQPVYGPHHDASIFNETVVTIGNGRGPTAAIALCIALLRAKEARDGTE